ncbi:DUF4062 domain-containing protein [Desulfoluna spongiiphila]|uniref:DUF4062 domain-containing protein n=1 Tax=Desulfoluna spongiiphila TaxID=419481 RepID=UPI0012583136|nr:DUF4062 domain-containing protein [Desulfoluna spongiiphila]VVS91425.1 domain of unknown function duf4062 [Desulfoluna spongiiphila]
MRQSVVLEVLIASPSDVFEERDAIENTVEKWNSLHAKNEDVILRTVRWEKDSFSQMGDSPQELLNQQIVDNSDIIIGVFWTKFGSPTRKFDSGTEEELIRSINSKKPVSIYFSNKKIEPEQTITPEFQKNYQKVISFKKKISMQGIYGTFSDIDDLEDQVFKGLHKNVLLYKKNNSDFNYLSKNFDSNLIDLLGIEDKNSTEPPIVGMRNLVKFKDSWEQAYNIHKGSYIAYNVLRNDPNRKHKSNNNQRVAASFLQLNSLTNRGIGFEWVNPHKIEHEDEWREFRYKGVALPCSDKFLYLFGDQLDSDYEVISVIIDYSTVNPPSLLTGQIMGISVNTDIGIKSTIASTGMVFQRVNDFPDDISDWYGTKLGQLNFENLPIRIQENMPKWYTI